jgi:cytochrome P450
MFLSHYNEKYWDSPHQFYPERFFEEKTKEAQKIAYFPFGKKIKKKNKKKLTKKKK